ncbi:MAG: PEPxxWA-CTERM sorting domain-containing protein [Novosphingobium sp.]
MISDSMIKPAASMLVLSLAACLSTSAYAAELVTNGGFETGSFTGWVQSGNTTNTGVSATNPHSGTYAAFFGPSNGTASAIREQNLPTIAGQNYTISFWLYNDAAATAGTHGFSVLFGAEQLINSLNPAPFGYTLYSYNRVASTNGTTLSFALRNDPGLFWLDDVSVAGPSSAVPEPSTWGLMLAGLGLVGGAMRSRRRHQRKVRFAF